MIKIPKEEILKIIEINPAFFIGKEMMLENNSVKIIDVNLKCTHFNIEKCTSSTEWIDVNKLPNEIVFDNFSSNNLYISIKTLTDIIKKE